MEANKVKIHRVVKSTPEKIFRAFTTPDALAKWMPPYGITCKVDHFDAKVGGTYKMSFTNFSTGKGNSFGGKILEFIPGELLSHTDEFDDPAMPGKMITKVQLKKVSCGTEMTITQEGIPDVIPVELCYLGWQESVEQLLKLVEPEIPD